MSKPVVLVGALDTKGEEFRFVRDLIQARGLETIVVDFGVMGDPPFPPDINSDEVARAGGSSIAELRSSRTKRAPCKSWRTGWPRSQSGCMTRAGWAASWAWRAAAVRRSPHRDARPARRRAKGDGVDGGGGDVSAYVGTKDITMMPSVVDVAGINSISRRIYANAAGAIAGMVSQELPEPAARRSR